MSEAWQHPGPGPQDQPTIDAQMLFEQPGGRIDKYKLLSILGEGGMGIVYLAEQERPVERQVALKVIKPGMDSKRVLARFEAEQQALAIMEHPHVARVHDAGLTPSGRPYFVMEHVKGIPVTEYCDKHRLSIEERLRLFLRVCEAVQYAHQKGIIHRDLKPSNILVTIEGEQASPKVIDFGVARAISQPLTERTLYTEQGQLVGTPEYMSPEQADLSNQDIDTRTDVYSLGVILYELVAGVLPFDPQTLRGHGIDGARKVICEEEPQTPSTRLSRTSIEESTKSAERRRTDIKQLQHKLQGDLDWITLRALEKDRTRRYGSASDLAGDIRRHLNHEPITAARPSFTYKAGKFVRRNRALVTGLTAVLSVLVIGVIVSLLFALRAERAGQEATAVSKFLQEHVFRAMNASERGGRQASIKEILDDASKDVSGMFDNSPLIEASIRKTLGELYSNVSCFEEGQSHLKWSLDVFTRELGRENLRTIEVIDELGRLYWGWWRYREAEQHLSEALAARNRLLGPKHPDTIKTRKWLGLTYFAQGYTKRAEQSLSETLKISRQIFGMSHPETMQCMFFYGFALLDCGQNDKAENTLTGALDISSKVLDPNHPLVAYPCALLGRLYSRQGRFVEADRLLNNALQISRKAWGEHNGGTFHNVAALAENYARQGKIIQAEKVLIEAVQTGEQTGESRSEIKVQTLPYPGLFYLWQRRYSDAEVSVEKSKDESIASYGTEHPITFLNRVVLGMVYREQGRYDDAEEQLRSAVNFTREYLTDESVITSRVLHELAVLYHRQGKHAEAERLHLEVLDIQRLLLVENHWHTLCTIRNLIALYTASGKPQEARKWFDMLKSAYADQTDASKDSSSTPGVVRYDHVMDTYTLIAPSSSQRIIEKELNFSLPEPSSETWYICDDLYFTYKTLDGDGSITAKIESLTPPHYTTQAGLMIRSTLEATSPNASIIVTPLGDVVFQSRTVELGATRSWYASNQAKPPCWVRLTRKDNQFTAQHSSDGMNWHTMQDKSSNHVSFTEIPMNKTVHIGMAITSNNSSRSTEAKMSNITVTGNVSPNDPFTVSRDISLHSVTFLEKLVLYEAWNKPEKAKEWRVNFPQSAPEP